MIEPKIVKIKECSEKIRFQLPDIDFKCQLQNRVETDTSKVVYIINPWYVEKDPPSEESENRLIAFCEEEYEVVKWTKPSKK